MIRSIRLRNFKCFRQQTIQVGPATLLCGLNSTGKSSVLQSLLLLRQSYQQGLLGKAELALNGDLVAIGTARDALFEGAEEDTIGFTLTWRDGRVASWLFSYQPEADVLASLSGLPEAPPFDRSLFGDAFHYLQAERLGPRPSFGVSDFSVRQHRQIGVRGEYATQFLSAFGTNDIGVPGAAHPTARSTDLRDQVEAWMGEISPGARLHFRQYSDIDAMSLQYSFEPLGNNRRSTNVGFGMTYTLPILVAILSSPPGALILLENPEAHLHPRGQVKMGELISRAASGGVQIIVETHSDHVLNGVRMAVHAGILDPDDVSIQFFDRHAGDVFDDVEITSPRIDRDGRIDQWPDGFFDEWDKSLEALLRPRGQ